MSAEDLDRSITQYYYSQLFFYVYIYNIYS